MGRLYLPGLPERPAWPLPLERSEIHCLTGQPGSPILLECGGSPGMTYTIQTSTNLVDWTDCAERQADHEGQFQYSETPAPIRAIFYRLRWP